jgi:serine/threonine protein kinase
MIGQTISHFRILEKLGEGGMGVVYKAHDTRLDRPVALKFLPPDLTRDPEARERFIHEAKAASALQHPNICTIHDIDETADNQLFIVMDCYEGETLKSRIAKGPRLPDGSYEGGQELRIEDAIDIALQVAQGLAKAHESGIIHRDIKPGNIIVSKDGIARIVDFGLAKLAGQTVLTKTGRTLGTVAYMSPEQARGEQVDQRTDIWSLGVVLYELLTGKRPFESEYEQALVYSILNEEPKPMRELRPEVPEAIEKICRRAMSRT